MMSKTHLTVGLATSLAICMPNDVSSLMAVLAGSAAGSILCDIECRGKPGMWDAAIGRGIAFGIAVVALAIDYLSNGRIISGIMQRIYEKEYFNLILGTVVLLVVCIIGRFSEHRTFTHSLLYVILIDFGFYCLSPMFRMPVLVAGLSHLIIDTFNKKPVPWLFPFFRPGICLKWCYASKTGNAVIMWAGLVASIALLAWRIYIISA